MKPFAILLSRLAVRDLDSAKEQGNAAEIDKELAEKFTLVAQCPEMGALVRRGRGWSKTDRFLVLDRSHRILYYRADLEAEMILVLRVPHEKQRPPRL